MNNLKKRRLGRGLEALLGASSEPTATPERPTGSLADLMASRSEPPLNNSSDAAITDALLTSPRPSPATTVASDMTLSQPHPNDDHSSNPRSYQVARVSLNASTLPTIAPAVGESHETTLLQLPVLDIEENPFQPRRVFSESEIASLSESLKEHDMLQPILVRIVHGKYQLISGERRLRAAIQAGWKTIPARVREADDRLVAELAIVENLQRKDLNAIEKALSFRRYLNEHQATQEELASRLKIDRSTIANLMRLLELPQSIQDDVSNNRVSAGHARAILPLGEEREQLDFCRKIVAEGWSVRETERRVAEFINHQDGPSLKPKRKVGNPQIDSLESQAKRALGTAVQIKANGRGAGRLIIHFKNDAEFQRIFEQLCQERGVFAKVA
ncbi:MAG: ParB/RepB/Spo0J family partition protein [Planctomycetaceae bacterium]|nr:ParB/RepB/Spo0J family partition protein [Planctomycetaceae bacterium]